jgi:S-formylglutathione hydrolase FrmB
MNRTCKALLLTAALFTAAGAASASVREVTIHSAALQGNLAGDSADSMFAVYLPPDYEAGSARYPVIYLLHGIADTSAIWTKQWDIPGMLDTLIAAKKIAPVIVVMPNARTRLLGSYYVNSPVTGNWADLIANEIVGYVDAHFRTLAKPASRAVVGHSMGGFGAIEFGMARPDVFGVVYAISPCCLAATEDIGYGNQAAWKTALGFRTLDDVAATLEKGDFYPVAIVGFLSATAPDPAAPLHVAFPMRSARGELLPNDPVYTRWRDALPLGQVEARRDNLRKLAALRIDVGLDDQFAHIPPSAIDFSRALAVNRIPHVFDIYRGEHHQVRDRMAAIMFPWVTERLSSR